MGLWIFDGFEEVGPVIENEQGGEGSQVLEEVVPGAPGGHGVAPGEDAELGDGMEGEGQ